VALARRSSPGAAGLVCLARAVCAAVWELGTLWARLPRVETALVGGATGRIVCVHEVWWERAMIAVRSPGWFMLAAGALVLGCASWLPACGGDSRDSGRTVSKGPIPASLRTAESASEDIIDLALQHKRDGVVARAKVLKAVADGPAARALHTSGAPAADIVEFQRRAAVVSRVATHAPFINLALASNAAFELVPAFFERYDSPVPGTVIRLDYLNFAAKLQSLKGDRRALGAAVRSLEGTWGRLRPHVVAARGARVAAAFDKHVRAMRALGANREPAKTQREAQHGLDLVDKLEHVYSG
jgi:hypothetical protein